MKPAEERRDEFDGRPDLIKKRARSIMAIRIAWTVAAIGFLVVVANAIVAFTTRAALLDCTQPEGDCATKNAKETAKIINQLINEGHLGDLATQQVVRYSAICSSKPENAGSAPKINACIKAMQAANEKKR